MDAPLVSVIIPIGPLAGQGGAWMKSAIDSAISQVAPADGSGHPIKNWLEVIVCVEDWPQNLPVIRDMERVAGLRVKQVSVRGPAAVRNAAAAGARGWWLAFLDADDLWSNYKTNIQVAAAVAAEKRYPTAGCVSVVYSNARVIGDDGAEQQPRMPWPAPVGNLAALVEANRIPLSTAMIRRDVFNRVSGFNEEMSVAEDYDLWLRVAAAGGRFCYVPDSLASYRVHPCQASADPLRMAQGVTQALRNAWLRSLIQK
jgi:hypothetical protein